MNYSLNRRTLRNCPFQIEKIRRNIHRFQQPLLPNFSLSSKEHTRELIEQKFPLPYYPFSRIIQDNSPPPSSSSPKNTRITFLLQRDLIFSFPLLPLVPRVACTHPRGQARAASLRYRVLGHSGAILLSAVRPNRFASILPSFALMFLNINEYEYGDAFPFFSNLCDGDGDFWILWGMKIGK